jgi:hypothetical protein
MSSAIVDTVMASVGSWLTIVTRTAVVVGRFDTWKVYCIDIIIFS